MPFVVDRKTSGTLHVPTAAVSIVGGIQPGVLQRALGPANRENGLAARLLLVMPPRRAKRWSEAGIEPATADAMGVVFERLFGLEHDTGDDGEPAARLTRLSHDAKAAYVDFYNEHAKELADAEGDWAAALSKLEELPLRLGLVIHLVRWAAGEVVDFHATRHIYVSSIVAGGASVKTAQELARHSSAALTVGRYSHARLHDLRGALEALPSAAVTPQTPKYQPAALLATGTEGTPTRHGGAPDKILDKARGGGCHYETQKQGQSSGTPCKTWRKSPHKRMERA